MKKLLIILVLLSSICYASTSAKFENITVKTAINEIAKKVIQSNNTILQKNDSYMQFTFPTTFGQNFWYGSQFNPQAQNRCTISLVQDNKDVVAQITFEIVSNPSSGFQTSTPMPKYEKIMARELEKYFNPHYEYGFNYKTYKNYAKALEVNDKIIQYAEGSEKLDYGDRIILINDTPIEMPYISRVNLDEIPIIAQYPEELKLTIKNKGMQEHTVTLKRVFIKPKFNN